MATAKKAAKKGSPKKMMHPGHGKMTVAAVTVERVDIDPKSETYGQTVQVELEPQREEQYVVPAGTKFGEYAVGQVYEIHDAEERKRLQARGFVYAAGETEDDVASLADEDRQISREIAEEKAAEAGPSVGGE